MGGGGKQHHGWGEVRGYPGAIADIWSPLLFLSSVCLVPLNIGPESCIGHHHWILHSSPDFTVGQWFLAWGRVFITGSARATASMTPKTFSSVFFICCHDLLQQVLPGFKPFVLVGECYSSWFLNLCISSKSSSYFLPLRRVISKHEPSEKNLIQPPLTKSLELVQENLSELSSSRGKPLNKQQNTGQLPASDNKVKYVTMWGQVGSVSCAHLVQKRLQGKAWTGFWASPQAQNFDWLQSGNKLALMMKALKSCGWVLQPVWNPLTQIHPQNWRKLSSYSRIFSFWQWPQSAVPSPQPSVEFSRRTLRPQMKGSGTCLSTQSQSFSQWEMPTM